MYVRLHGLVCATLLAYGCAAEGDATPEPVPALPSVQPPQPGEDAEVLDASPFDAGSAPPSPYEDAGVQHVGDDPLTADSACAASAVKAQQVVVEEQVQVEVKVEVQVPKPVNLFVMLDRSQSMASSLWSPAVSALKQFIRDDMSKDMDMAIQYFPSNSGSCNGNGYKTPAVAMGTLPAHAAALVSSIDAQDPDGWGTPIEGALRGVTEYCKSFQTSHPNESCIGVVVTDGKPELDGCEHDDAKLAKIAGDAWTSSKVRTFAVGLSGADFGLLDKIAQAGGAADCDTSSSRFACDVSAGADRLSMALAKIRDTVTVVETQTRTETHTETQQRPLDCEWQLPAAGNGKTLDLDKVNVKVSGGTGAALSLGRVPSAAACTAGAWYYDNPLAPTRLIACPATCDSIKSGGYTEVSVLLGCQTVILLL
jgi:hypothetical protein